MSVGSDAGTNNGMGAGTGADTRTAEQRRARLQLLEDHIGRALRASAESGELQRAPSWGRPLAETAGWEQTPPELRLPFKILEDAGVVPAEVQWLREIAVLEQELASSPEPMDPAARKALQRRIADRRQRLALRLEKLRLTGQL
ncbi:MAG: DnaJ family domain-containing protein [Rubrivivax sp.]